MKKELLSILFIFIISNSFSQTQRVELIGVVLNPSSNSIKNSHIINLTTKEGIISNSEGVFRLRVQKGDWLQISNIQFNVKKVRVTSNHIKDKFIRVYLIPILNHLDEVKLQKKMTGFLSSDRIDKKKDTIGDLMKNVVSGIMSIPYDKIMGMGIGADERHLRKPTVAPGLLLGFKGVGVSATIPYADLIKKRANRKKIDFKERFPEDLKKTFGDDFFFDRLKIPKENYYHFLEYCNPLGIETLYKNEKYLDVLKILLKESKSYLLLLENNK